MVKIDEIKKIEISILNEIAEYCNANQIKYFLLGGTLLGAVRHRGFIPWDDDIDIAMPREDYEKFKNKFISKHYSMVKPGDKDYYYPFLKVVDNKTELFELDSKISGRFGVYVDVFPIDNVPNDLKTRKKYFKKLQLYKDLVGIKNISFSKKRSFNKKILIALGKMALLPLKIEKLVTKMDSYAKKIKSSDFKANAIWGYGIRETTRSVVFDSKIELEFEDGKYWAPTLYDEWLYNIFGDYMKLPPVEDRVSNHSFVVKWKDKEKDDFGQQ